MILKYFLYTKEGETLMTKSVFTDQYQTFLSMLVKERKKANLTQVQLASTLKKPQSFISKYEKGERRLDVIEFLDIARAIGFDETLFISKLK